MDNELQNCAPSPISPGIDLVPWNKLDTLLKEGAAAAYRDNQPFPNVVWDNFFNPADLQEVLREFPTQQTGRWKRFHTSREVKLSCNNERRMGPYTRALIHQLNSGPFCQFLSALTGIPNLFSDPYLDGGGLHQIPRGGKLAIHADYNLHPQLHFVRRVNLLLYFNESWRDEYGGHLEMWDPQMEKCQTKVSPIFNRLVIFSTTNSSFHGHPDPLTCPPGHSRKSLALYYFTNGLIEQPVTRRGTSFFARPGEKFSYSRSHLLRSLVPPLFADFAQKALAFFR